jgi:hypothetical protein
MRGQVVDGLDRLAADGRTILVHNSADSAHRDRLSYARSALRAWVTAKPMLRRAIWAGLAPGRKNREKIGAGAGGTDYPTGRRKRGAKKARTLG